MITVNAIVVDNDDKSKVGNVVQLELKPKLAVKMAEWAQRLPKSKRLRSQRAKHVKRGKRFTKNAERIEKKASFLQFGETRIACSHNMAEASQWRKRANAEFLKAYYIYR